MYIYICIYMYIYICVYIYVYIYIYVCVHHVKNMLRSGYIFRQEIQEYAMFDWEGTPCNTRDSVLDGNDLLRN